MKGMSRLFGIIALVAIAGFTMAACDNDSPDEPTRVLIAEYNYERNNDTYNMKVFRMSSARVAQIESGDIYELTIISGGRTLISQGTVAGYNASTGRFDLLPNAQGLTTPPPQFPIQILPSGDFLLPQSIPITSGPQSSFAPSANSDGSGMIDSSPGSTPDPNPTPSPSPDIAPPPPSSTAQSAAARVAAAGFNGSHNGTWSSKTAGFEHIAVTVSGVNITISVYQSNTAPAQYVVDQFNLTVTDVTNNENISISNVSGMRILVNGVAQLEGSTFWNANGGSAKDGMYAFKGIIEGGGFKFALRNGNINVDMVYNGTPVSGVFSKFTANPVFATEGDAIIRAFPNATEREALWKNVEPSYFVNYFNAKFNEVFNPIVNQRMIEINAKISAKHVELFNKAYGTLFNAAAVDANYIKAFETKYSEVDGNEGNRRDPLTNEVINYGEYIHEYIIGPIVAEAIRADALVKATKEILGDCYPDVNAKALEELGYKVGGQWEEHEGTYRTEYLKLWNGTEAQIKRWEYFYNGLSAEQKALVIVYYVLPSQS